MSFIDEIRREVVLEAMKDYKYLLNRGYPQTLALNTVTTRYMLTKKERLLLYRTVHNDTHVYTILRKIVNPKDISGQPLLIDGYNVILTIKAAVMCEYVYESDDTFLRDLLAVHGGVKYDEHFRKALEILIFNLRKLNASYTLITLDKQVSKSGELASLIRELLRRNNIKGDAETVIKNDAFIIGIAEKYIVCTSDVVILLKAKKVFDLAGYIIRELMPNKVIRLKIPYSTR